MTELYFSHRFMTWSVFGYDFKNKDWYPLIDGFTSRGEAEEARLRLDPWVDLNGNFRPPYPRIKN